ncbi:hypothetical protein [Aestuariicoccus sp. MJ-SS9]|uniref:hypothetical protein n=1 Tax=Aestuariicoccus sp. MJ-SS9 TaxID=3079855 RepID=UPI0029073969|nr:hypothetical protein [Aestuariicoccus sp. MJ-SS9]MDU8913415.1 hypothetical protein [Aestuariicoccus sp. MJ-SS9]
MSSDPSQEPQNDDVYRYIRSEIQFELSLINARVNWLIASQAFLFTPLIVGLRGNSLEDALFYPVIPLLGIVLCALVTVAILAAVWRSAQWRAKARKGDYSGLDAHDVFSIVLPHTPQIPFMGLIGSLGVPLVLAATWLYLLVWPPAIA